MDGRMRVKIEIAPHAGFCFGVKRSVDAVDALLKAGRMSQTITLPCVNAGTIGQLMYFFELATAYAGELLGIDAFDQPGVEQSKIASYAVLGNKEEKYVKAAEEMSKQTLPFAEYVM